MERGKIMRDDNCIFCKIANGEIPSATLYEDEEFRVILDLGPASVFHFHMHLIPRYKNDNVGLGWHMGELTEEDKKEILEKLK